MTLEPLFRRTVTIFLWQIHCYAERPASRNNCHLVNRVVFGHQVTDDGMASFMISRVELFFFAHHHGATLRAHHDFVFGQFKLLHADHALVFARRKQRSLVDEVSQVSAREARSTPRDDARFDIVVQRHLAHVYFQNQLTTANIRQRHDDLPVKAARAQQRRVKHVRPVSRCNDDNAFTAFETVHFNQHLVEGLFTFIVTTAQAGTTVPPNSIQLIDEDNARRLFFRLIEHVAHT